MDNCHRRRARLLAAETANMHTQAIIPIIITPHLRETRRFYVELLGFELSYDHAHYLGVRGGPKGAPELGFMPTIKADDRPFPGTGFVLALHVANADRECERVRKAGVKIVQELTDNPWGTRSFLINDPSGVVISISHAIAATVEFQASVR